MKKLISALTSLCMAASMVSSIAPIGAGAVDSTKSLTLKTFGGASSTISASDIAAGDVTVPCAMYLSEATNDTTSFQYMIGVQKNSADPTAPSIKAYQADTTYYSSEQTFKTAAGKEFSTDLNVFFAGEVDRRGNYSGAGAQYVINAADSQPRYDVDYACVGGAWITNASGGYEWIGSTSDAFPVLYFDVVFPKGSKAGDYEIDFYNYNNDESGKTVVPSTQVNGGGSKFADFDEWSNLKLEGLTITIEGGASTPDDDDDDINNPTRIADVVIDLGKYSDKDADSDGYIAGYAKINTDKTIGGFDAQFDVSELTKAGIGFELLSKSPAFGSKLTINENNLKFNGAAIDANGEPQTPQKDAFVEYDIQIPDNCAEGTYRFTLTYAYMFKEGKSADQWTTTVIDGYVVVGNSQIPDDDDDQPVGNADVIIDLGKYSDKDADSDGYIAGFAKIDTDKTIGGFDAQFDVSALTRAGIGFEILSKSPAFGSKLTINEDNLKFNGAAIDANGKPQTPKDDAFVEYDIQIPDNCPDGTYKFTLTYVYMFKEGKSADMWKTEVIDGYVVVGNAEIPDDDNDNKPDNNPVGNADVTIDLGKYSDKDADSDGYIAGFAKIDTDKTIGGFDAQFDVSELTKAGIGFELLSKSPAFGSKLTINENSLKFNGAAIDANGKPQTPQDDAFVEYDIQIPDNCPDGTYKFTLTYVYMFKEGKSADMWKTKVIDGVVTVGETTSNIKLGDVNDDGTVDARDATLMLKEYAAASLNGNSVIDESLKPRGDVNNDDTIDARDATIVLRYYAYVSLNDKISIDDFLKL